MEKIKYETANYGIAIREIIIEKETDQSVWVKGDRKLKETNHGIIADTAEQAKNYLIQKALDAVETAKRQVEYREEELQKVLTRITESGY